MRWKILTPICLTILMGCASNVEFTPHEPIIGSAATFPPYEGEVKVLTEFPINIFSYDKIGTVSLGMRATENFTFNTSLLHTIKSAAAQKGANAIVTKSRDFARKADGSLDNLFKQYFTTESGQRVYDTEVYAIRIKEKSSSRLQKIKDDIIERLTAIKNDL